MHHKAVAWEQQFAAHVVVSGTDHVLSIFSQKSAVWNGVWLQNLYYAFAGREVAIHACSLCC